MIRSLFLPILIGLTLAISVQAKPIGKFSIPEPITATINLLRKDPSQNQRVEAFDKLITQLESLSFSPINQALERSDLDPTTLEIIAKRSKGLFTVDEILTMPEVIGGFSLGLSAIEGQYELLSERINVTTWSPAYANFDIDWRKEKNHTALFLEQVTLTNKAVVFMLPNALVAYNKPSITKNEFTWFMNNPHKMKNVYFVLGAYEMITPGIKKLVQEAGISQDMFRALFMRALGAESSDYDQAL